VHWGNTWVTAAVLVVLSLWVDVVDGGAVPGRLQWRRSRRSTTTPFDMVMLNDLDRYHLVMDVIDRVPQLGATAAQLRQDMADRRVAARAYTRETGEDLPEVTEWAWPS
jgi:phosphoketolase